MNKKRGFLLMDMIVSLSLYTVIILSLIILLGKNMRLTSNLYKNNEIRRIEHNIKNIVRRDIEIDKTEDKNYKIIKFENKLYLENIRSLQRESLGSYLYLSEEKIKDISVKNEKIIIESEEIGNIWMIYYLFDEESRAYVIEA